MPQDRSLIVSASGRYLKYPDGRPFFYLADTAWELFHRLNYEEAVRYLQDRAGKGFTAIQAVLLSELDGLTVPSATGHLPLQNNDPTRPNEPYFADVDRVVRKANELGLFIAMLPTWGDKWHPRDGTGPALFDEQNAFQYGQFLGRRYREARVIWVLGGDRIVSTPEQHRVLTAMAHGLRDGDRGRHCITFHPCGQYSSAIWFHNADWLDFNMVQTGHTRDRDNYNSVAAEYARTPIKPVIDGEPGYENIPHAFNAVHGRLDAHQARKFAYWSVFSGACGHTYGCNDIWQMYAPHRQPVIAANTPWYEALHFPGSGQMCHVRNLIESGPYFDRLPDQSLIASPNPTGADHVRACRDPDGRYALLYLPTGLPVTVRTFLLQPGPLSVAWYDPRTGQHQAQGTTQSRPWSTETFTPPGPGDWVLVLTCVAGS